LPLEYHRDSCLAICLSKFAPFAIFIFSCLFLLHFLVFFSSSFNPSWSCK
jgi:hypothetical protein